MTRSVILSEAKDLEATIKVVSSRATPSVVEGESRDLEASSLDSVILSEAKDLEATCQRSRHSEPPSGGVESASEASP